MENLLAEAFGFVGFILTFLAYQCNKRKTILLTQSGGLFFQSISLYLFGAFTGAAMMLILMVRNYSFSLKGKYRWADHWLHLVVAIVVMIGAGYATWIGYPSLFAFAGAAIGTYALWLERPRHIRLIMVFAILSWLPYALIIQSFSLLLVQVFVLSSVLIAIWRYDRMIYLRKTLAIFSGTVERGDGYGRTIGFPTANISRTDYTARKLNLPHGVYAGVVQILDTEKQYPAGIVVGPLDATNQPKLEAHLLDFDGDLYGQKVEFIIQTHLRPFVEYDSETKLKAAIAADISKIRQIC